MMKKYILPAIVLAMLATAGCSDSGTSKPAGQTNVKGIEAKQETVSNTEANLTRNVEELTKSREEALARYDGAVAAYEKVRDEIIRKRADLQTAQENGQSTSVEQLTEALKPLSRLEAGAVTAHKELLAVSDEFAKKSAELAVLRKKM